MAILSTIAIYLLIFPLSVLSKGIILYGKGKVPSGKKGTNPDESDEASDKFQFTLFTPTQSSATPSESFKNFSNQAISATLIGHSQQRIYYFMQEKKTYDTTWMGDSNVCHAEAKSWQLHPHGDFLFADSEKQVVVYFLCDQYCCSTQCCDINVIFVVCMVLFALIGLTIPIWLCCRYGRRVFQRPKEVEDDEFVDALDYFEVVEPRERSASQLRTQSLPLKVYSGDDVRL